MGRKFFKPKIQIVKPEREGIINTPPEVKKQEYVNEETKRYSDNEHKLIVQALNTKDRIDAMLELGKELCYEELKDINISYNPKDYPLLHEAITCPFCGNKNASSVINYDAIQRKKDFENKLNSAYENSLGMNDKSFVSITSKQEIDWAAMIAQQGVAVVMSVIKFIFQQLKTIFAPAKNVPGLEAVPKLIDSVLKTAEDSLNNNDSSDTLNKTIGDIAGIDNYDTIKKNNSLANISTNCIAHLQYWKNSGEKIINESGKAGVYNINKLNDIYINTSKSVNNLFDLTIPEAYEYESDGSMKKYKQQAKDTDANGSLVKGAKEAVGLMPSMFYAGEDGLLKALDEFEETVDANIIKGLKTWWKDPNTFCCLVVNLLKIGSANATWLSTIRLILEAYKIYLMSDFSLALTSMNDFIYNVVNKIMNSVMSALSVIASKYLNNLDVNFNFEYVKDESCLPLNLLLNYVKDAFIKLKKDLFGLIGNLIYSWRTSFKKSREIGTKLKASSEVDFYIFLIDSILSFLQSIKKCNDNYNSKYYNGANIHRSSGDISKDMYNKIKNSSNESISSNAESLMKSLSTTDIMGEDFKNNLQISNDTLKNFLSNQLKLNNEEVTTVINSRKDCQCDNVLSEKDIKTISEMLQGNK